MTGVVPVGVIPPVLGVVAASSWANSSPALCHRSAGRFSRQRIRTPFNAADTAARWRVTGSGACVICAASSACGVGATNGVLPVSIS
jgi:hypothetical protein